MRCFIAINVPQEIEDLLATIQQELARQVSGLKIKWSDRQNLHLTLRFLGEIVPEQKESLTGALPSVVAGIFPFPLRFTTVGCFPGRGFTRVIWIGIDGGEVLPKLVQAIEDRLADLNFPHPDHPFQPHLTLGRLRSPQRVQFFMEKVTALKELQQKEILVKQVTLFQSILRPAGPLYEELAQIACGNVSP